MKHIQGFGRGMNQDTSKEKYSNQQYYSMSNFRVVTHEGLSTGSIESEKGHTLSFIIPDLPTMTHSNGDVIPAQTDLKIIGVGNINDTIIVFTTNSTSTSPTSYGQIWKFTYDESINKIDNISATNELTVADHLVYNNTLNFSTEYRIGRIIGRYETANKQRVYWTDNYNPVRVINIAADDTLGIDPENLDLKPAVNFAQPVIKEIGSGNVTSGTALQIGYRLLDSNGAETLFSPLSVVYPITSDNPYTDNYEDYNGGMPTSTPGKSITYTIKGLDTDFRYIEHVVVWYGAGGINSPTVFKFNTTEVPPSGEIENTFTGSETLEQFSLVDFNLLSSGFDVCKDLDVKDNRLIAANTRTEQFDLDFDARAYRFNNLREAKIEDSVLGDETILGATLTLQSTGASWTTIDEEHDAINPFNNENDSTWLLGSQYKYQADGTTLGGQGPNVSYEFVNELQYGDTGDLDTVDDHVKVFRHSSGVSPDTSLGVTNPDGSLQEVYRSNQFYNNSSPYIHAHFRGHARGEVYRYGVVFHSLKGSTSFVKWIGDIKMPEPEDGYYVGGDDSVNNAVLYNLGLRFTIDITSIREFISGVSYVRVERKEEDKTRIGTGILQHFEFTTPDDHSLSVAYNIANGTGVTNYTDTTIVGGSTVSDIMFLGDYPGFPIGTGATPSIKQHGYLVSPIGRYAEQIGFTPRAEDFIKTYGFYEAHAYLYYADQGDDIYSAHWKTRGWATRGYNPEYIEVEAGKILQIGQTVSNGDDIADGVNRIINAGYSRAGGSYANIPVSLGTKKLALKLNETPSINNAIAATSQQWQGGGTTVYTAGAGWSGVTSGNFFFKEVAYCRYVTNQYGGNTYEDRSQNQYISCGHFQAVNDTTPNVITNKVFGGDTFVTYYEDEVKKFYRETGEAFESPYGAPDNTLSNSQLSMAIVCPCESPINTNLQNSRWSQVRSNATPLLHYFSPDESYNMLFSQENNVEQKFFAKDFLSDFVEEQPNRIWASELKVNGELIDSWRQFKSANYTEVDGNYGPINRIINYKDILYYFQDSAFGAASINQRSTIVDESGQQIALGNGGILDDYRYVSVNTGSIHQFGVTANDQGIYWYDARLKKLQRFTGQGQQPLSDLKGLSSTFDVNVYGDIVNSDRTLSNINNGAIGVHAIPDFRYNRILFTFLNNKSIKPLQNTTNVTIEYNVGDLIYDNGLYYEVNTYFTASSGSRLTSNDARLTPLASDYIPGFTISYNEMLEAFESYYGYKPGLYYNYGRRLLSIDPYNKDRMYEHNNGTYCSFYGRTPESSEITLLVSPQANLTKIFNNIEFSSEVYLNDVDVYDETIDSYQVFNEYQDTGTIPLTVNTDIKRRMRKWRLQIERDNTDSKSRIRNPWVFIKLKYDNNGDKRFILHDVIVSYTISQM